MKAYVSTQSAPSAPHSWLSRPHANQERAHRAEAPSREGPQAADCFVIDGETAPPGGVYQRLRPWHRAIGAGFMTCFALPNEVGSPRLGIAASQKIGNAVVRNRAKRLVRELFRGRKPLTGLDIVVIPRREMRRCALAEH